MEYRREPRALRFWYDDYSETTEQEVTALLSEHVGARARKVDIEVEPVTLLSGQLTVPWGAYARGAVLLARGPRSTPLAQHSKSLAGALNKAGFATLLLDLLPPADNVDPTNLFDLAVLAQRLIRATHWLRTQPETARLTLGYLGVDSGSAAALVPAAKLRAGICSVVGCEGCPKSRQVVAV